MKYRILKKGPWYYPQYRKYGIWWNFKRKKPYIDFWGYYCEGMLADCKVSLIRAVDELKRRSNNDYVEYYMVEK